MDQPDAARDAYPGHPRLPCLPPQMIALRL
jgi:hypothetical protein